MDIERCFEILEIEPDASSDEVKQGYKDLVHVWHPDRFPHNPRLKKKAEEKMKEVNLAYEMVIDPSRNHAEERFIKPCIDERRKHPRSPCAISVNHATKGRAFSSIHDFIQDISAGGVFIETKEYFVVGQKVSLTFTLPRFGELVDLGGEVVRQSPTGVGVEFKISSRYQKLLSELV